jgi:hypothetical protein
MRLTAAVKSSVKVAALIFAFALFASVSKADTTYTYTGNLFDQFVSPAACPTECKITGSFTVATPLTPSSSYYFVPASFSFTDGAYTFNQNNTTSFAFGVITNELSQIIGWNMDWSNGTVSMFSGTGPSVICTSGCTVTDGRFLGDGLGSASVVGNPGTWSTPGGPTGVPEPSTIVLLAAGLMVLTLRLLVKATA